MRSPEEIRHAIAVLGCAFAEHRREVWGPYDGAEERAWAAFSALGWVMGADDTEFAGVLEHVESKVLSLENQPQEVVHGNR